MEHGNIIPKEFEPFRVTVPLRLDIGGTWDLKAFALPFEDIKPCTVNIAIDLPTTLKFSCRDDDLIHIQDDYSVVTTRLDEIDFRSSFGLLLSICCHYQCAGFDLEIIYSMPPGSGLGGSGALAAGLIYGIDHIQSVGIPLCDIAVRVNDIEEGLRFSHCGLQDQCAALYGGVNKWTWHYSKQQKFTRERLLAMQCYYEISDRLLVAYLGRGHGADINQRQIDSLYDLHTRYKWFDINELTHSAVVAIRDRNWQDLADCINEENQIRIDLVPERLSADSQLLWETAEEHGGAFGIAGAGAGGCVFAFFPDPKDAVSMETVWWNILAQTPKTGLVRNPKIAEHGICLA
jgi:D-glycero-alpha-D-manno-heptose-7-phosphate kinase